VLERWLIELVGHVSGLSDAQVRQIEKSLPATKALIDLLSRAHPIIEQARSLYSEAEPLIDEAKKEWQTVGPAAQILIDVISHHIDRGSSPADAAEKVRAALDGSIDSVAKDPLTEWGISCVTVFGGTGFVGSRVARHLRSQKPYPIYELAGPRIYSYEELLRTVARIAGLRPVLIPTPFALWDTLAGLAEMLPQAPLTRNQVELMRIDTTASENLPVFRALAISPRALEGELEAILSQNNPRVLSA
jgi:hypothetical protein